MKNVKKFYFLKFHHLLIIHLEFSNQIILKILRGVGNLSNRNVYEVPSDAKKVIEGKLREWSKEFVYDKWNKSSKKAENLNKPESLYDQYFKK